MDLTGQEIYDMLAQQVTGANARVAQDPAGLAGLHLQARARRGRRGRLGEAERDADRQGGDLPDRDEQLPAGGGDGFPAFTKGTDEYFGGLDIDAFADYLSAHSPYTPGPLTRITQ